MIVRKMKENGSRQFRHVMRKDGSEAVRVVMKINVEGYKGQG